MAGVYYNYVNEAGPASEFQCEVLFMKLYIGENIKRLRRERDMTQEELAELLGVSFQSVSRWETGACYPDTELLPDIAAFFGVSADALMGLDAAREEAAVRAILDEFQVSISDGDIENCIKIAREGLKVHPSSYALMNKLMYALFMATDDTADIPDWKENQEKYDHEITQLGERIMKYCPDQAIRFEATARLAFNHCEMGRKQRGREIYESLPGIENSREGYIWWALDDAERAANARDLVFKSYDMMSAGMWQLLALDTVSDADKEEIMKAHAQLRRIVKGDAYFPYSGQWHIRCARVYARQGKYTEAIVELKKAVEQAKTFEARPESGTYGTVLIGQRTWKRTDYEKADSRPVTQVMAESWLNHEAFDSMREMPEFREIKESLIS